MTKISKRVIISVLTLILTVAAIGTTTFAWFSLSTVSNISNITGEVRATGGGLDVRLVPLTGTPTSWQANLDAGAFMATNYSSLEFDGVSTANGTSFTKMGTGTDGRLVVNLDPATASVDYLEFRVQFKSDQPGKVSLTSYNLEGDATNVPFSPDNSYNQTGSGSSNTPVVNDPSNALRLLFAAGDFGTVANAVAYQKEALAYDVIGGFIVGNNAAAIYPVTFGQWSYLTQGKNIPLFYQVGGVEHQLVIDTSDNNRIKYNNIAIQMLEAYESVLDGSSNYRSVVELEINNDSGTELIADVGLDNYVGEFVVRIWIEGWDADAYNAIYLGKLNIELTFEYEAD